MVVLDLFADVKPVWKSSNNFYGIPYIWCMLHNFGGNIEMYGKLDTLGSEPVEARNSPNSTMVGVGMCMEGIEQNPVVYELIAEMAFQSEEIDVKEWIKSYSHRRYGGPNSYAERAWETLHKTIYNCQDGIANEWNARTQVTMWFDNTADEPSQLHDYANKYWSGLVGDYYLPRMALYLELLQESLTENVSFPYFEWRKRWISLTNFWQSSTNVYPIRTNGDSIEIAWTLFKKYSKLDLLHRHQLQLSGEHTHSYS